MKKTAFVLISSLFSITWLWAQTKPPNHQNGAQNSVTLGINIPVGEFSATHLAGISSQYSWSDRRFGILGKLPQKRIGFMATGGIDYYFGKKEKVAGYDYKYGGYIQLYSFGGIIYNPSRKGNITFTGGPVMNIYKSATDVGFGFILNGSSYFNSRIAITPGIIYTKYDKANALWAASLKATYIF